MAGDLATMKARIADELSRDDLTSQIALAIGDAIQFYQNARYSFNESRDMTFSTVAGQDFYGSAANSNIPTLFAFDYLILYLGSIPFEVTRAQPLNVELLNQNGIVRGQPYRWCYYNHQIRLGPVPDQVYLMRIAGQITFAAPASDGEVGNPWMLEAEKLIRSRAKYELALNILKDPDMAGQMAAQVTEADEQLGGLAKRLTGTGQVRPMAF